MFSFHGNAAHTVATRRGRVTTGDGLGNIVGMCVFDCECVVGFLKKGTGGSGEGGRGMMCKGFLHVCFYGDTFVVLWKGNPLFSPHLNPLSSSHPDSPLLSNFFSFLFLSFYFSLCFLSSPPLSFVSCSFAFISLSFLMSFHLLPPPLLVSFLSFPFLLFYPVSSPLVSSPLFSSHLL